MKKYFAHFFLLTILTGFISFSYAQSTKEVVKKKVDEALTTHIKKIYPPKNCPNNDAAFFYKKKFEFTKNMQVGKTLRLWGKASVIYRNSRTGGSGYILFYTEINKVDGEVTVTKLRWQLGKCMQMTTLFEMKS